MELHLSVCHGYANTLHLKFAVTFLLQLFFVSIATFADFVLAIESAHDYIHNDDDLMVIMKIATLTTVTLGIINKQYLFYRVNTLFKIRS